MANSGRGTTAALQELYNTAIQSLDELKLNSTAMDYAAFCRELEQITRETMMNSIGNRRMQMARSAQYYSHLDVPIRSHNNIGKKVNKNVSTMSRQQEKLNGSLASLAGQVKIGMPTGVKLPGPGNEWTSSEENSEDEEKGNMAKEKEKMPKKKHNNVSKKKISKNESNLETVEKNKKKSSLPKQVSAMDEPSTSKEVSVKDSSRSKRQDLKNDTFDGIEADFVLKNWSLRCEKKNLIIQGDQYDRKLNLLKTDFVSSPITSARKIQGKFVIKTRNISYLLFELKMKSDKNLPDEVKKYCKNEFPLRWRQCLTLWDQINQTLEEPEIEKEVQVKEKKLPETKKQKNALNKKKTESKAQKEKNEKKAEQKKNEPENNGRSIFQKMMADDSLDEGNCMTPSALLNSIKKSNVSVGIHTPPSNFLRDLQSTSVFELSVAKSSDLKKKQNSKVVERMTKNIKKNGNVRVQNVEPHVMCEKVNFDKILAPTQETSAFGSESELSSICD